MKKIYRACQRLVVFMNTLACSVLGGMRDRAGRLLGLIRGIRLAPETATYRGFGAERLAERTIASMDLVGGGSSPDELVHHAYLDWVHAQRIFAEVSEPDLVDQAIYLMNAAEKYYGYVLKQARRTGGWHGTGV